MHRESNVIFYEFILVAVAAASAGALIWFSVSDSGNIWAIWAAGCLCTAALLGFILIVADPNRVRAHNTDKMLTLASQMLEVVSQGLNFETAQKVCELLLPATSGVAVAITDTTHILGYAGVSEDGANPSGKEIRTQATKETVKDGQTRLMMSAQEIGFSSEVREIKGAIIVPLKVSNEVKGTLKFYYSHPRYINDTQRSIAEGFGEILSTQMAVAELEEQKKMATTMELRILQTQINPHFLFNTLNTIAAFIRIDPDKARVLLRDFATFYRKTLEDSGDLIELRKEVDQTKRYFSFELARFGEESLELVVDVPEELENLLIPSFLIQPIVENSVRHGRRAGEKLTITVSARAKGDDLIITVKDDGVGMTEEQRQNIMHAKSTSGLGIAVKNINERVRGYFGPESTMTYGGEAGVGTTVELYLKDGVGKEYC
ncbi:MAG: histidine kinase [Eggerthellales bacterium]|nr:histidine kinase [Eggerthellales bacterium]